VVSTPPQPAEPSRLGDALGAALPVTPAPVGQRIKQSSASRTTATALPAAGVVLLLGAASKHLRRGDRQQAARLRHTRGRGLRVALAASGGSHGDGKTFIGRVKTYNPSKGFGFIECAQTFAKHSRDVFLHKEQAVDLRIGDHVSFEVELNQRKQPQARNVQVLMDEGEFEALGMNSLVEEEVHQRLFEIMTEMADAEVAYNPATTNSEQAPKPTQPSSDSVVDDMELDEIKAAQEELEEMEALAEAEAAMRSAIDMEEDPWAALEAAESSLQAAEEDVKIQESVEEKPPAKKESVEVRPPAKQESAKEVPAAKKDSEEEVPPAKKESSKTPQEEQPAKKESVKEPASGEDEAQASRLGIHPLFVGVAQTIRQQVKTLEEALADMASLSPKELKAKSMEYARLSGILGTYDELVATADAINEAESMAKEDGELGEMAKEELSELRPKLVSLQEQVQLEMLPRDAKDDADTALLEIRPGVGGNEAGIWAEDLMNMYMKYCQLEGLEVSIMDIDKNEGNLGIVGATIKISGEEVYSKLKFESGVHRVQRIPKTDTDGRMQTSTATVAIMPEVDETEVVIDEKDIEFKFMRAGGKGGQNVNKLETACHATHLPSGLTVTCRQERTQLANKNIAIKWLAAKLQELEEEQQNAEIYALRKAQVGSGGRTEKVRSYNFKESRVSDHRLGENFPLQQVLDGNLQEAVRLLRLQEQQEKLRQMQMEAA